MTTLVSISNLPFKEIQYSVNDENIILSFELKNKKVDLTENVYFLNSLDLENLEFNEDSDICSKQKDILMLIEPYEDELLKLLYSIFKSRRLIEDLSQSGVQIIDYLYFYTQENMIIEQKSWDDEDEGKSYDFTTSKYWIAPIGEDCVVGIDDEEEMYKFIYEHM